MNILLCTDLDRTLLPNGSALETHNIRQLFNAIVELAPIQLAYVSGRNLALVEKAVEQYNLLEPDWIASDVGTQIWKKDSQDNWQNQTEWLRDIEKNWRPYTAEDIIDRLADIPELTIQPQFHQSALKVSFFVATTIDEKSVFEKVHQQLAGLELRYRIIWSIDEPNNIGLLDVVPADATKLHAIEYIARKENLNADRIVFAGDSGNDIPVFTSRIRSIVVKNAHQDVISEVNSFDTQSLKQSIFIAGGKSMTGNGNYASGILEGLLHYHPELTSLAERLCSHHLDSTGTN